MRSPKLADIPDRSGETFSERGKAAKKVAATKGKTVKLSVSLGQDYADYLNKHALALGRERGKPVNTSEALRDIIDGHRSR